MPDEILDTGSQESVVETSPSSIETSGSSEVNLQDRMQSAEDYWLDDGSGYYDKSGEPVFDSNGKHVSSQEELDALLNARDAKIQPQQHPVQQQHGNQNVKDGIFDTSGQFDPIKSNTFLADFDRPYVSNLSFAQQPTQQPEQGLQQSQQQLNQEPAKRSFAEEINSYSESLRSNLLQPLELAIEIMQEKGFYTTDNPKAVEYDRLYKERQNTINGLIEERKNKLIDEALTSKNSERENVEKAAKLKQDVEQSIFQVSQKFKGRENFEQLMFGKNVVKSGKQEFQRGAGADLVEAIIDLMHDGQQIKDVKTAYEDGWSKIAKNAKILDVIAKYASGYYVAKNLNQNNKMVRQSTIQEERNRQKFVNRPPQSNMPGSAGGNNMPDVLKNWGYSTV